VDLCGDQAPVSTLKLSGPMFALLCVTDPVVPQVEGTKAFRVVLDVKQANAGETDTHLKGRHAVRERLPPAAAKRSARTSSWRSARTAGTRCRPGWMPAVTSSASRPPPRRAPESWMSPWT
jgi:hypothetical protein